MLSEIFFSLVITTGVSLIITVSRLIFKSKCKEVSLCCLKCIRDVEVEERATEFEMTHRSLETKENI